MTTSIRSVKKVKQEKQKEIKKTRNNDTFQIVYENSQFYI